MSVYEDDYIPIVVNASRERRRSPIEVGGHNKIYLAPSNAGSRPRAASTGAAAQPINLTINAPSEGGHSRRGSRHRKYRDDRSDSDDSPHSRHSRERRRSRYADSEYDELPSYLRREAEDRERERAAASRRERERWESDYRDREDDERRRKARLLEEAKEEEAKKKRAEEDMRRKIIEEEEEKKKKAKKKKEEEERDFEEKVRQKFRSAGYSDERIDRVLNDKRKDRDSDRAWAIDLSRPTFIKVNRKYLSPDTLDHYRLPWEWDKANTEYIIIKKYIDEDFQDILFEHTRTLKEKKLITSGYEKDVVVKLKPTTDVVYKEKDKMYLVREKSKSPGRARSRSRSGSWMFT